MITTKVTGLDKAIANFSEDMTAGLNQDILDTAKNYALGQVMRYTPVDTGRLRADWPNHTTITPFAVDVKNIVEYAPYQEYGTLPRPAMRKGIAQTFMTKGYKGAHMAMKAANDLRSNMDKITKIAMTKWLGRFKT